MESLLHLSGMFIISGPTGLFFFEVLQVNILFFLKLTEAVGMCREAHTHANLNFKNYSTG